MYPRFLPRESCSSFLFRAHFNLRNTQTCRVERTLGIILHVIVASEMEECRKRERERERERVCARVSERGETEWQFL